MEYLGIPEMGCKVVGTVPKLKCQNLMHDRKCMEKSIEGDSVIITYAVFFMWCKAYRRSGWWASTGNVIPTTPYKSEVLIENLMTDAKWRFKYLV